MDSYPRRLNWGCGPEVAAGWANSDIVDRGQDHVGDVLDGLPWPDGYFDGIVANHSLQALRYDEVSRALAELHRVLARGGRLRILVPDVIAAAYAFVGDAPFHESRDPRRHEGAAWAGFQAISEPWPFERKFLHYLTWGGQNRTCWSVGTLVDELRAAGFITGEPADPELGWLADLDSRLGESVVVEAVKP